MYKVVDIYYIESCTEVELINDNEDNDVKYYGRLYAEVEQLLDYISGNDIIVTSTDRSEVIRAIKSHIQEYEESCIDTYSPSAMYFELECTDSNHVYDIDDLDWGEVQGVSFMHGDNEVSYELEKINL